MSMYGFPPRLAAKSLFRSILEAVVKQGETLRKSNILDRLYYPDDHVLQIKALQSDCGRHGVSFEQKPNGSFLFFQAPESDQRRDFSPFVANNPHLRKAG